MRTVIQAPVRGRPRTMEERDTRTKGREGREPLESRWPDRVMTARALAGFMEEARQLLERLEDSRERSVAEGPVEKERQRILDCLTREEAWVDFMDLPRTALLGRSEKRRLVRRMAEEGLLELRSDPTYPNMISLRVTPNGREELRRSSVREAMSLLNGGTADVHGAVTDAREALRALGELI